MSDQLEGGSGTEGGGEDQTALQVEHIEEAPIQRTPNESVDCDTPSLADLMSQKTSYATILEARKKEIETKERELEEIRAQQERTEQQIHQIDGKIRDERVRDYWFWYKRLILCRKFKHWRPTYTTIRAS